MLKERRELLEKEVKKVQTQAASMYFKIVSQDGDVHSVEYQDLKNKIMNLKLDLDMVNDLIAQGKE
jgi:uncharacterized tellurite resistance protein B-like protein